MLKDDSNFDIFFEKNNLFSGLSIFRAGWNDCDVEQVVVKFADRKDESADREWKDGSNSQRKTDCRNWKVCQWF